MRKHGITADRLFGWCACSDLRVWMGCNFDTQFGLTMDIQMKQASSKYWFCKYAIMVMAHRIDRCSGFSKYLCRICLLLWVINIMMMEQGVEGETTPGWKCVSPVSRYLAIEQEGEDPSTILIKLPEVDTTVE